MVQFALYGHTGRQITANIKKPNDTNRKSIRAYRLDQPEPAALLASIDMTLSNMWGYAQR
jgi:hypothetical protein